MLVLQFGITASKASEKMPDDYAIDRTIVLLDYNLSPEDIRERLISSGLTEYQAFLAFKAAKLLIAKREEE